MKFLFLITFTIIANASIAQTTDNTPSAPSYQQTVNYLQEKVNKLKEGLYTSYEMAFINTIVDFKILKSPDGNIVAKIKETIKAYKNDKLTETFSRYATIPICDIEYIRVTGSKNINIVTQGETIEYSESDKAIDRYDTHFYFKLREEESNTLEKIKKAFLHLKSFCPAPKKDIFDN